MIKRIALAIGASFAFATSAHAGALASCREPFAFVNADVNVVVLPYFQSGAAQRPLNGLGSQLALLLKLETLYRALSYDKWGVVLLTGTKEECDPARVTDKLVQQNMIHPGGRLIVVFGKVYQQDNDVYVQTFARALRRPAAGQQTTPVDVIVPIGGKTFQGRVGASEFAFPPQQLSVQFIDSVAENFQRAIFVYSAPKLTASKQPLHLDDFRKCDVCPGAQAFVVLGRQGTWIHIRMQGRDNGDGYLLARPDSASSLDGRLPEVSFIHGLMGFMRYTGQPQPTVTAQGIQAATDALARYARRVQSETETETVAAAMQLGAVLDFVRARGASSSAAVAAISQRFDDAYQLVPYNSDVRNTAGIFRLLVAYNSAGRAIHAQDIANDLTAAVALDPTNPLPLANLQSFYELLSVPQTASRLDAGSAIAAGEVQSQLAKVKAIRQRMAGPR